MADSRKRTPSKNTKRKAQEGRKAGKGQRTAREQQDTGFMRAEVIILCSFAVAVLLFLSNFNLCGAVGQALRSVQLGLFGLAGFLAPILLFVGTCFHMSNQNNIHAALKLGAVILAVVAVCGLLQLLFGTVPAGSKWMEYYHQSCVSGRGGGWLGGVLTSFLILAVGRAGAYLVLLVLLILCIVYITERSFVMAVRRGGGRAYTYAREDMDRRREMYEQRVRERRAARQERQARELGRGEKGPDSPEGFPDVMARETAGNPAPAQAEKSPSKPSGADVFSGRISLPPDYEEQDKAPKAQPETAEGAGERKAGGKERQEAPGTREPKDSYILHADGQEEFFVPRDHRTLREMDFIQDPAGPASQAPAARETEIKRAGEASESRNGFEGAPWDEEPAAPVSLYASQTRREEPEEPGRASGPALTLWEQEPEEEIQVGAPEAGKPANGHKQPVRQEESPEPAGPVARAREERPDFPADLFQEPPQPEEGAYDPRPVPDGGVSFDRLIAEEKPKRVVTASGKVIETETELLQKKMEKKKRQAAGEDANFQVAEEIQKKKEEVKREYVFPPTTLLKARAVRNGGISQEEYKATAIKLQQTLHNFGVGVTVTNISCGPAVTRYELLPEQGVKVSRLWAWRMISS